MDKDLLSRSRQQRDNQPRRSPSDPFYIKISRAIKREGIRE